MNRDTLIEEVKRTIKPEFKNWVLFENGTHIMFRDIDNINDIETEAIKLLKKYGPVFPGTPSGDFTVIKLNKEFSDGWIVSGHCEGMFTYVSPKEMKKTNPHDME